MKSRQEIPEEWVGFEAMALQALESLKSIQQILLQAVQEQKFSPNFQGANIHNLVINGNMVKNGNENYNSNSNETQHTSYSDEQIARALVNIVGKNKAIDSKQKWAGAHWFLRWECNYPAKPQDFCNRIDLLGLPDDLEFKCDYSNIRAYATLSFMNEDPRYLEAVRYSKNDEQVFFQMRSVVIALREELQKIKIQPIGF